MMIASYFLCCSFFLWHRLGLAETCLSREENVDDLAGVSLLQSHMSLDSSVSAGEVPKRTAPKKAEASAAALVAIEKVAPAEVAATDAAARHAERIKHVEHTGQGHAVASSSVEEKVAAKAGNKIVAKTVKEKIAEHSLKKVVDSSEHGKTMVKLPPFALEDPDAQPADTRTIFSVLASGGLAVFLIFTVLQRSFPDLAYPFLLIVTYIMMSSGLITFNKYIMQDNVWPYAMALTTLHMTTTWLGLYSLYRIKPEMFPQMQLAPKGAELLGVAWAVPQYFGPLGCFFAVGLFGGNAAYHYCSVAFLQFMKETNVVWLFVLCVIVGSQQVSRARVVTLAWIVTGAGMAVTGEIHFVMLGFVIQAMAIMAEVCKNVLGEFMMTTSSFKLDALTYTMSLAPVTLVPLLIGTALTYEEAMLTGFIRYWPLLLVDASIAVAMNVCVALVIKNCSAVAFILSGLIKDILLVGFSAVIFGDIVTGQQICGFVVCLSGIGAYSSIKLKPQWWEWLSPGIGGQPAK
jgi:hypothetical protein